MNFKMAFIFILIFITGVTLNPLFFTHKKEMEFKDFYSFVNQKIGEFSIIKIKEKNNDYHIIEVSNVTGLLPTDKIVSDLYLLLTNNHSIQYQIKVFNFQLNYSELLKENSYILTNCFVDFKDKNKKIFSHYNKTTSTLECVPENHNDGTKSNLEDYKGNIEILSIPY